jgi:hypothetical protein
MNFDMRQAVSDGADANRLSPQGPVDSFFEFFMSKMQFFQFDQAEACTTAL